MKETTAPKAFKTIGILGGMGPAATALLFDTIIKQTPAQNDQEHLPVFIYNLPQIPDRTIAILKQGPSPVPMLQHGLRVLEQAAVDFVIIPCNTVFYFYPDFAPRVNVPIVHIAMPVIRALQALSLSGQKIGVLSTTGTRQAGIYEQILKQFGFEPLLSSDKQQAELMQLIHALKAGKIRGYVQVLRAADELMQRGATSIILACTELSLLFEKLIKSLPVIDSSRCLANAAIQVATGEREVGEFILSS